MLQDLLYIKDYKGIELIRELIGDDEGMKMTFKIMVGDKVNIEQNVQECDATEAK